MDNSSLTLVTLCKIEFAARISPLDKGWLGGVVVIFSSLVKTDVALLLVVVRLEA